MSYARRERIPITALIDIDDDAQVARWAYLLEATAEEVVRAIDAVGPLATAVRDYLAVEE